MNMTLLFHFLCHNSFVPHVDDEKKSTSTNVKGCVYKKYF